MSENHKPSSWWRDYIAWRPDYYYASWKVKRYLKNSREYLNARKNPVNFDRLLIKPNIEIAFADTLTAIQVFNEIFVHDNYPLKPSNKSSVILDAGANVGLFSIYAHLKQPKAAIYSIEANPRTFSVFEKNIQKNGLENIIHPFNFALGGRTEKVPFYMTAVSGWSSLYNVKGAEDGEQILVDQIKLSDFSKREQLKEIDFLKMDIEGAEYAAVLDDKNFFSIPIREIVVEADVSFKKKHHFADLKHFLAQKYKKISTYYPGDKEYPLIHCVGFRE